MVDKTTLAMSFNTYGSASKAACLWTRMYRNGPLATKMMLVHLDEVIGDHSRHLQIRPIGVIASTWSGNGLPTTSLQVTDIRSQSARRPNCRQRSRAGTGRASLPS